MGGSRRHYRPMRKTMRIPPLEDEVRAVSKTPHDWILVHLETNAKPYLRSPGHAAPWAAERT
jgi:hypothetical protein